MGFQEFLNNWAQAAYTSTGFFWMALWAFVLGYAVSAFIQVFITQERMHKAMGQSGFRSIFLGSLLGFISSSCSFSALATTKSLFQKGASFVAALAFLLASTNLVIELGIVISIFLGWQFVLAEYLGGALLILCCALLLKIIKPSQLIVNARQRLEPQKEETKSSKPLAARIKDPKNWIKVGQQYGMEWKMVWKDVTIGFTVAGLIAAFVPDQFFETLFINSKGQEQNYSFLTLLQHVVIGPVVAFLTFIGSMGNIPLAALLFGKGVSFAGVMAFIFSDLVVFPVLRINAKYYGWKMSLFILFLLFSALVLTSLVLHYGFTAFEILPENAAAVILEQEHFKINYTLVLNVIFLIISALLVYQGFFTENKVHHHKEMAPKSKGYERLLTFIAYTCYLWLLGGLLLKLFF